MIEFLVLAVLLVAAVVVFGGVFFVYNRNLKFQYKAQHTSPPLYLYTSNQYESNAFQLDPTRCKVGEACKEPDHLCVHVDRDTTLVDGETLSANVSSGDGYCLKRATEPDVKCNPNTSSPVMTVTPQGSFRVSCRCHWPTLYGQTSIYTNCDVPVGCGGGRVGRLVHKKTGIGLLDAPVKLVTDIHSYVCQGCDEATSEPGVDQHTGLPGCVPKPLAERDKTLGVYERENNYNRAKDGLYNNGRAKDSLYNIGREKESLYNNDREKNSLYNNDTAKESLYNNDTTKESLYNKDREKESLYKRKNNANDTPVVTIETMLTVGGPFVDESFADSFENAKRNSAKVPNPCAFDALTGYPLNGLCALNSSESGIAYCSPTDETVSTMIFADDYLNANGGNYANACYRFTHSAAYVLGYVVEYFVRPRSTAAVTTTSKLPLPVVSMLLPAKKIDAKVARTLRIPKEKIDANVSILVTQAPVPDDALRAPVPIDVSTMDRYRNEFNDLPDYLPGTCWPLKCAAPVQPLPLLLCKDVGTDRQAQGGSFANIIASDEHDRLLRTTVGACSRPDYDTRLTIVPNIDVFQDDQSNADPTTAVLFFDKSDLTVKPYWWKNPHNERNVILRYLAKLKSRPRTL